MELEDNGEPTKAPQFDFATLKSEMGVKETSQDGMLSTVKGKAPITDTTDRFLKSLHSEFNHEFLRKVPFDRA